MFWPFLYWTIVSELSQHGADKVAEQQESEQEGHEGHKGPEEDAFAVAASSAVCDVQTKTNK